MSALDPLRTLGERARLGVVSRVPRFPLLWLLIAPALISGCVNSRRESLPHGPTCGVRAAMDFRQPERYREMPPACSLPTAGDLRLRALCMIA
jgi:hypothetical protein